MKNIKITLCIVIFYWFGYSCSSDDTLSPEIDPINNSLPNNAPNIASLADKISGTYSGIGKKMPNRVSLGSYTGCVTPPNWESNFVSGTSTVVVTKIDDINVNIKIFGGAITTEIYSPIALTESNSVIDFVFGTYNYNSGYFSFSRGTSDSSYITTNACLQGLPYYSGSSGLNDGVYTYSTIGHIDFTGTKL
jgi:hypothetical protein